MTFDQRGQKVSQQYNAGRDINLGAIQHSQDLAAELEKLKSEIVRAKNDGHIDEEQATDVEYQITKAAQEARKPQPNKKTLLDRLNQAKSIVEDIAAMGGFVTTIVGTIDTVRKLFP